MALTPEQRAEAARTPRRAERTATPVVPLSERPPGLELSDAYAIQQADIGRRLGDGATAVGHKAGLASWGC